MGNDVGELGASVRLTFVLIDQLAHFRIPESTSNVVVDGIDRKRVWVGCHGAIVPLPAINARRAAGS
jgi:hypothetical protein